MVVSPATKNPSATIEQHAIYGNLFNVGGPGVGIEHMHGALIATMRTETDESGGALSGFRMPPEIPPPEVLALEPNPTDVNTASKKKKIKNKKCFLSSEQLVCPHQNGDCCTD